MNRNNSIRARGTGRYLSVLYRRRESALAPGHNKYIPIMHLLGPGKRVYRICHP